MEDAEIYELASAILSRITNDTNDTIYAPLGGKLSISWSEKEIYGAYASSLSQSDKPPQHSITIYYEFVRQVWRDIENFCEFLQSRPEGDFTPYEFYDNHTKLPDALTKTNTSGTCSSRRSRGCISMSSATSCKSMASYATSSGRGEMNPCKRLTSTISRFHTTNLSMVEKRWSLMLRNLPPTTRRRSSTPRICFDI